MPQVVLSALPLDPYEFLLRPKEGCDASGRVEHLGYILLYFPEGPTPYISLIYTSWMLNDNGRDNGDKNGGERELYACIDKPYIIVV